MRHLTFILTFGFIAIASSAIPARAGIDWNPAPIRFGFEADINYQSWFGHYLQFVGVYAPPNSDYKVVKMLQASFERLKGVRRPVLHKNITRETHEIWIVRSSAVEAPTLQWEKVNFSFQNRLRSRKVESALITVPSSWNMAQLTVRQKHLFDRIVLEASPELVVVLSPDQSLYGGLRYHEYVREWQINLKYEYYLQYPEQINDQTVSQVFQDLEIMFGESTYLGNEVYAYSKSKSAPEIRQHLQQLAIHRGPGPGCVKALKL